MWLVIDRSVRSYFVCKVTEKMTIAKTNAGYFNYLTGNLEVGSGRDWILCDFVVVSFLMIPGWLSQLQTSYPHTSVLRKKWAGGKGLFKPGKKIFTRKDNLPQMSSPSWISFSFQGLDLVMWPPVGETWKAASGEGERDGRDWLD